MSFFKRLFSGPSPEAMANAVEKAQKLIDENNAIVFSKSYCPYCRSTKGVLNSIGADFKVIELDQESDGSELQDALEKISGQRTVPNVYIGKKHIGGNSDLQALNSKDELVTLLKEAGAIA
jgi:glutaredoxin 3